jgi:hypothetical protein
MTVLSGGTTRGICDDTWEHTEAYTQATNGFCAPCAPAPHWLRRNEGKEHDIATFPGPRMGGCLFSYGPCPTQLCFEPVGHSEVVKHAICHCHNQGACRISASASEDESLV